MLAGAVALLDACLQNFIAFADCSLAEGLCAVTLRPALALGSRRSWAAPTVARVLLREEDLHHHHYPSQQQQQRQGPDVLLTRLAGNLVWRRDNAACAARQRPGWRVLRPGRDPNADNAPVRHVSGTATGALGQPHGR